MAYVNINHILTTNKEWSGGELDVKLAPGSFDPSYDVLVAYLQNSNDVVKLLMVNDAIKRYFDTSCDVVIPYLPYARQDRVCNLGEPFSLKVFADMLNRSEFNSVTSFDVHSNAAELLIDNFVNISPDDFVYDVVMGMCYNDSTLRHDQIVLVSPDVGSFKKVEKIASLLEVNHLPCIKTRSSNGDISNIIIPQDSLFNHYKYLIVDDICDGGRTFVALAEALRDKGAYDIALCVSHGIFSHGTDHLISSGIQQIYSTNSWYEECADKNYIDFDFLNYL